MSLEAKGLSFAFKAPILRDLSARFDAGRISLIVGPNGAGKTTLLRLLLGLLEPDEGACLLDGEPLSELGPRERAERMAYVPHRPEVGFAYSVREYVGFAHAVREVESASIDAAIARLELERFEHVPLVELSAGQIQRASIARALAQLTSSSARPRYLLADEPTSALDPRHVSQVLALFRDLACDEGIGVVMTMHDIATAAQVADEAFVLDGQGTLTAQGPPESVLVPEVLDAVFDTRFDIIESNGRRVVVRADALAAR
ncbi:MAG: ABC transporter ATP-binding protein [Planctomycetota bacterium]|nr:MAG: ABC transporter ATP-binding protein [Planctomycetota bacterium]